MKLMKKVLVLALAAAIILMVACDNGNGGGGTSSSGADGNGGGTNTGSDTFVPPTLPESKGDDPFEGLKTLTTDFGVRYQVDTTKKVLTQEGLAEDGTTWSESAECSYSYDGTANPPTITGRIDALYEKGKRVTPAEALAAYKDEFKEGFTQDFEESFNQLSSLDAATKKAKLAELNEAYGLTLTEADLAADKKAATLEKVWNSKTVQDMLKEQQDAEKEVFSMTPTYAVTLTDQNGTTAKITVEGQYDSKLKWHEQTTGDFYGRNNDYNLDAFFMNGFGSVEIEDVSYDVTDITEKAINCRDRDGNSKSFSYTATGTGKDTVVTITVEDGKTIECTWQPMPIIGKYW